MVALFDTQHEVHRTLKDAQKILGVQVGHPGRLQRMHWAERQPLVAVHCLPEVPCTAARCSAACCSCGILAVQSLQRHTSCQGSDLAQRSQSMVQSSAHCRVVRGGRHCAPVHCARTLSRDRQLSLSLPRVAACEAESI